MELLFNVNPIRSLEENDMMVQFDTGNHKDMCGKKPTGMWSNNYIPSKVMCFLVIPDNDTTYAVIHSTNVNNHKSDSILFERWQLETSIHTQEWATKYLSRPPYH